MVKNPPANAGVGSMEMWVRSLGWEDPLEKEMATQSSMLAWEIPWTEEPGVLQSMRVARVGHDFVTKQQHLSIYYLKGGYHLAYYQLHVCHFGILYLSRDSNILQKSFFVSTRSLTYSLSICHREQAGEDEHHWFHKALHGLKKLCEPMWL